MLIGVARLLGHISFQTDASRLGVRDRCHGPWAKLEALIEPYYSKMGPQGGRRPFAFSTMLRRYCLQQWSNLSDPVPPRSSPLAARCSATPWKIAFVSSWRSKRSEEALYNVQS